MAELSPDEQAKWDAAEKLWTPIDDACKAKINAVGGPTPMKVGSDGLQKIKNIEHRVASNIQHGKGKSQNKIMSLAWGPGQDDDRMAVVDQLGTMFVWDTVKGCRLYGGISKFAQCLALKDQSPSEAGLVLVGGMKNATMLMKQTGAGQAKMAEVKTWIAHDGYISSLAFLPDNKYISSSGDADVRIFDIEKSGSEDSLVTLRGHEKDAQSIKFARDGKENTFITCSSDKTVKLWDMREGKVAKSFATDSELNACAFFPNGNLIAAGGEKDKTYVFDVRAYRELQKYARNNMKTASCEFSSSGRELYVGHDDGAIIVWDMFASGENKNYAKKIQAHGEGQGDITKSRVQVLDVGSKGYLASGGFDGAVKIWGAPAQGAA